MQEGTAIFLDGLPAPKEFISSQLVRYCLFVCLFVCWFVYLFIHCSCSLIFIVGESVMCGACWHVLCWLVGITFYLLFTTSTVVLFMLFRLVAVVYKKLHACFVTVCLFVCIHRM